MLLQKGSTLLRLNKKKVVFISGVLISIICSWLFAGKIEWVSLKEIFREANYIYIIPTIIVIFLSHYIRAVRWSSLIAPIKRVSILNLFSAIMIGFMANSILPARVGEIIRPIVIARRENIKITTSFATIVIERVFDLLSIIVFASLLFLILPSGTSYNKRAGVINSVENSTKGIEEKLSPYPSTDNLEGDTDTLKVIKQLKKWSVILTFLGIFAIVFLFLLTIYPEKTSAVFQKLIFFFPHNLKDKLIDLLASFIAGLQVLDNNKRLPWIGVLSLIIWFFNAASVYVLCYSFNIGLSFAGACFVIVCIALAVALPQAPGYIGVFHIAIQKSLDIFGVELPSSQSYAIMLWVLSVVPVTLAGLLFLWREGMSLGEISKYKENV